MRRNDGSVFAPSRAAYLDALPGVVTRRDAKTYVRTAVGMPDFVTMAMLDAGSTYSVLDADVAEWHRVLVEPNAPRSRWGRDAATSAAGSSDNRFGFLRKSETLEVDATLSVSPEWRHGHFLGYAGLVQRIRFGLDPQANGLYFGLIEA